MCTGAQQDELEGLAAAYGSSGLEESAQDRDLEERVERHVVCARAGGQASVRSRACTTIAEGALAGSVLFCGLWVPRCPSRCLKSRHALQGHALQSAETEERGKTTRIFACAIQSPRKRNTVKIIIRVSVCGAPCGVCDASSHTRDRMTRAILKMTLENRPFHTHRHDSRALPLADFPLLYFTVRLLLSLSAVHRASSAGLHTPCRASWQGGRPSGPPCASEPCQPCSSATRA